MNKKYKFPYWGPLLFESKVDDELLSLLLKKGNECRDNGLKSWNTLAGVIEDEFYYEDADEWFSPKFSNYINYYVAALDQYTGKKDIISGLMKNKYAGIKDDSKDYEVTWGLTTLWINYQKMNEYNPPHNHAGDLSFVIYLKIPDELKEENDRMQGVRNNCGPGVINFEYGERLPFSTSGFTKLPEKGDLFIFPSWLTHHVYGFESDVERISVAGNIVFKHGSD